MPTESLIATNAIMWDMDTSSFFDRTSSNNFIVRHIAGDDDDDPTERRAALSFDTATALKGSDDITSATLTLKFSVSQTQLVAIACLAAYDLNAIPANFSEATSFIYGRPNRGNIVKSIGTVAAGDTITFDVASQIKQIICDPQWAGGTIVLALYYIGVNLAGSGKQAVFHSIGATNAADRPKLDITWTSGSGNASNADTVSNFNVVTGADDGEVEVSDFNNRWDDDNTNFKVGDFLGDDDDDRYSYKIAIRFDNVTIPQGKTINAAIIELKTFTSSSWAAFGYTLYGDDSDNPTSPTSSTDYNNKPRTTASSSEIFERQLDTGGSFGVLTIGSAGEKTYFPCTQQLQEIVDRDGFSSGNAVQFLFDSRVFANDGYGGFHRFAAFEHSTYEEPILRVSYGDGGGGGGGESSSTHIQRLLLGVG